MRRYTAALVYSNKNPDEVVPYIDLYPNNTTRALGFLLDGKDTGVYEHYNNNKWIDQRIIYNSMSNHKEYIWFWAPGEIKRHQFYKNRELHGEMLVVESNGTISINRFYLHGVYAEEIDYLLDTERDEAFYVTLALYGIDKEYTCG